MSKENDVKNIDIVTYDIEKLIQINGIFIAFLIPVILQIDNYFLGTPFIRFLFIVGYYVLLTDFFISIMLVMMVKKTSKPYNYISYAVVMMFLVGFFWLFISLLLHLDIMLELYRIEEIEMTLMEQIIFWLTFFGMIVIMLIMVIKREIAEVMDEELKKQR